MPIGKDPWDAVAQDPRYQALDYSGRQTVAQRFFDRDIASDPRYTALDVEGQGIVRERFMKRLGPPPGDLEAGEEVGTLSSFIDAVSDGFVSTYADFQALGGAFEAAEQTRKEVEDTQLGLNARTAGSVVSGIAPTAAVIAGGIVAPPSLVVTMPALLGFYAMQSAGATRQYIHDYRRENPDADISGSEEALVALGVGATTLAIERIGLRTVAAPLLKKIPPAIMKTMGRDIMAGQTKTVAGRLATLVLGEGAEEGAQQAATNAIHQVFINPEQAITEGVADASIVGGLGGGLLLPLGGKRAFRSADAQKLYEAKEQRVAEGRAEMQQFVNLVDERVKVLVAERNDPFAGVEEMEQFHQHEKQNKFYSTVYGLDPEREPITRTDRLLAMPQETKNYLVPVAGAGPDVASEAISMAEFSKTAIDQQKIGDVPDVIVVRPTGQAVVWQTNKAMDLAFDAFNGAQGKALAHLNRGNTPAKALALADDAYTELLSQWNAANPGDVTGRGFQTYLNDRVAELDASIRKADTAIERARRASGIKKSRAELATLEKQVIKGRARAVRRRLITRKSSIEDMTPAEVRQYRTYLRSKAKAMGSPAVEEKGLLPGSITEENVVETTAEEKQEREPPKKAKRKEDPVEVVTEPDEELAALQALVAEEGAGDIDALRLSMIESNRTDILDDFDDDDGSMWDEANVVYKDTYPDDPIVGTASAVLAGQGEQAIAQKITARDPITLKELSTGLSVLPPMFNLPQDLYQFDEPTIIERQRLTNTFIKNGLFTRVHFLNGQLIGDDNHPVMAAVMKQSGEVWFSGRISHDAIGHEAFHRVVELLGQTDPVVQEGLAMAREALQPEIDALNKTGQDFVWDEERQVFTNKLRTISPEEFLSDVVGDYYANRTLERNLLRRLANWLQDLYVRLKEKIGFGVAREDLVNALNARMTRGFGQFTANGQEEIRRRREAYHNGGDIAFKDVESGSYDYAQKAEPRKPFTVNISRLDVEQQVASRISEVDLTDEPLTNEQLRKQATDLILKPQTFARARHRFNTMGESSPVTMLAMRVVSSLKVSKLTLMEADAIEAGKEIDAAGLKAQIDAEVNFLRRIGTAAGRQLQQQNVVAGPSSVLVTLDRLGKALTPKQNKEFIELVRKGGLDDPVAVKQYLEEVQNEPRVHDMVWELYVANLLSSPATQAVNAGNNWLWLHAQVPARVLEGAIDATLSSAVMQQIFPSLRGRSRRVYASEVIPMWHGRKIGKLAGKRVSKEFLRRTFAGESTADITSKFLRDYGSARRAMARATVRFGDNAFGRGIEKLAPYITIAPVTLAAVDVYFKEMGAAMQMQALAHRRWKNHGVPIAESLRDPTEEMQRASADFGRMVTFSDRTGTLTNMILSGREKIPFSLGKFAIPFVTTLTNIFKRGLEFTPGAPLATKAGRKGFQEIDPTLLSRQLQGAFLLILLRAMFDEDDITAGVPSDPVERSLFYNSGKIPHAVRFPEHIPGIGGTWISYGRIEPFNTALSVFATLNEVAKGMEDGDDLTESFGIAASSVADNLIENTYTQNLSRILYPRGTEGMEPAERAMEGIMRVATRIPSNLFVPYSSFWRSMNRALEAEVADPDAAPLRERITVSSHFADTIPFNSVLWKAWEGPTKVNALGEEITFPGGIFRQWIPLRYSTPDMDPVEEGLAELGWMPGLPSRRFDARGQEVTLEGEEYWEYAAAYGANVKKKITPFVTSRSFARMLATPEGQERALRRLQTLTSQAQKVMRRRMQSRLRQQARAEAAPP